MVTRTGCFSGVLSIRISGGRYALLGTQLVDLAQQFLDAGANLFAVRLQALHLIGKAVHLGAELGALLKRGFLFLPQTHHKLNGTLNTFFQTA
jgi:hypothetical protein